MRWDDYENEDDFLDLTDKTLLKTSKGCLTYIALAWLLTIVLSILKLTNVIDLTWIEATMFFWFPFAAFAFVMAVFLAGTLVTGVFFFIISGLCLLIDWIKKIFRRR